MRTPFDRWDVGPIPCRGVDYVYGVDGLDGTAFAVYVDRRWEFIATHLRARYADGIEYHNTAPYTAADLAWLKDRSKSAIIEGRAELLAQARAEAKWYLENPQHVLSPDGFYFQRPARIWDDCPSEKLDQGLIRALESLRDGTPITKDTRALWLVEAGCRWGGALPGSADEACTLVADGINRVARYDPNLHAHVVKDATNRGLISRVVFWLPIIKKKLEK
jgi:hypothetical protein